VTEVRAASVAALAPGGLAYVDLGGVPVVLARVGDAIYACGNVCAHKGAPLSEGKLSGARLACPAHGFMYDVRTGLCTFPGRGASVPSYRVRVDGDAVFVEVP
jgi:nitrite reductase/ring-hydroxylating ferredoxin subunit